jgi:hypothetical protein
MFAVTIKATVDFNTVKNNFERFGVDGAFISRLVIQIISSKLNAINFTIFF